MGSPPVQQTPALPQSNDNLHLPLSIRRAPRTKRPTWKVCYMQMVDELPEPPPLAAMTDTRDASAGISIKTRCRPNMFGLSRRYLGDRLPCHDPDPDELLTFQDLLDDDGQDSGLSETSQASSAVQTPPSRISVVQGAQVSSTMHCMDGTLC